MTLKNTQFKNLDIFSAFLLMILSACLITSPSLFAQDADESAESTEEQQTEASDDEVELSKISVTGSRIKRSEIEGPQPLVVLTRENIEQGGFISVYEAVASVSQNTGDFQGAIASGGFTPGAETINLRDFGPGNLLVLVNGKRRADYPFPYSGNDSIFNWNAIPLSLVERIEILTTGASAIYGSDAVAGVINVILIDGLEEVSVRARAGTHIPGHGDSVNFEITGGGYGDKFSYAWGLEFSEQDPIQGMDRDEFDSNLDDKDARYRDPDWALIFIDFFGPNKLPTYWGEGTCEEVGGYITVDENTAQSTSNSGIPFCGYDAAKRKSVRNQRESESAYITGTYQLTDNVEMFADYFYWKQESEGVYFPRFYFDYYYGYAINDAGENLGFVGGVTQRIWNNYDWNRSWNDETNSFTVGARGNFDVGNNIWDWELIYTDDDYDLEESSDFVSVAGIQTWMCGTQVDSPFCADNYFLNGYQGLYNPSVWNRESNQSAKEILEIAGIDAATFGTSGSTSYQLSLTGEILTLPAGPLAFAFVMEDHHQEYFNDATQNMKDGEVQYEDPAIGGGERSRDSIGLELSVPITPKLTLGLATRQDEYDELSTNIGDRRTDSATFAWRPTSRLLVRGSWGESFKAPSLPYIYKGDTTAYSSPCDTYGLWLNTGNINANCSGFNQINTPIISGGNLDLVEEEGENFSVGFVFDVIDTSTLVMDLTLDLFQVELENVTSNISSAGLARDEGICRVAADGGDTAGVSYSAAYCADVISKVIRGAEYRPSNGNDPAVKPTIGSFSRINVTPLNKGYLFFQGADISTSARYLSEDAGDFYASFAMSYVHDERRADEAGEEPYSLWDGGYLYRLRTKSYLSFGWDYNKWSAGINYERWGHMEGGDGKISPYNETGVWAQYRFDPAGKQYIQVNINNVFDDIPDKVSTLAWPFFQDALLPAVGPEVFVSYRYTF